MASGSDVRRAVLLDEQISDDSSSSDEMGVHTVQPSQSQLSGPRRPFVRIYGTNEVYCHYFPEAYDYSKPVVAMLAECTPSVPQHRLLELFPLDQSDGLEDHLSALPTLDGDPLTLEGDLSQTIGSDIFDYAGDEQVPYVEPEKPVKKETKAGSKRKAQGLGMGKKPLTTPAVPRTKMAKSAPASQEPRQHRMNIWKNVFSAYDADRLDLDPEAYTVRRVVDQLPHAFSLTEICYGFMQINPPLVRVAALPVCFCDKHIHKQAEFVYCQRGLHCNHFVHKHCVSNVYYVKSSQYSEYFRDFVCEACCDGATPMASSSGPAEATSRRHRGTVTETSPTNAASSSSSITVTEPALSTDGTIELLQVVSCVDENQVAQSTVYDGSTIHHISLSNIFHGYLTLKPTLPAKLKGRLKFCFCQKIHNAQAEYVYCKAGRRCNHYVHVHCLTGCAFYKGIYIHFRNNFTCDACNKDDEGDPNKLYSPLYWDEADMDG